MLGALTSPKKTANQVWINVKESHKQAQKSQKEYWALNKQIADWRYVPESPQAKAIAKCIEEHIDGRVGIGAALSLVGTVTTLGPFFSGPGTVGANPLVRMVCVFVGMCWYLAVVVGSQFDNYSDVVSYQQEYLKEKKKTLEAEQAKQTEQATQAPKV